MTATTSRAAGSAGSPAGCSPRCTTMLTAPAERRTVGQHRCQLLSTAASVVVEIGAGTGANLPHYRPEQIQRLVLVEPEPHMRRRLTGKLDKPRPRAARPHRGAARHRRPAPPARHSADTVVSTLVLCSVSDLPHAAREITRVLRPTGQLLLLEHVRADTPTAQRWQHRLTPLQRRVAAGCHLDRDTLTALHDAGLRTGQLRTLNDARPARPPPARRRRRRVDPSAVIRLPPPCGHEHDPRGAHWAGQRDQQSRKPV